jgi:NADH:ubiquinone oxidoreductase subunit E
MGSACRQLGVYEVLPQIQELLAEHSLEESVELKGAFCLGPCAMGIVMHYGEVQFTGVRPHNVREKFVRCCAVCTNK